MIDSEGFRPNVGIILANDWGQVLWAKRVGQDAWQFPQGGIQYGENSEQALYRELYEEIGLLPEHVEIIAQTKGWLRYRLPYRYIRSDTRPICIGQKQQWFLLKLVASPQQINLNLANPIEFDDWHWVSYWYPLSKVVNFKREVYRRALAELYPALAYQLHKSQQNS